MFPIAGQTAGPNGLKFFEDTHGPWVAKGRQRQKIDYFYFFFFSWARPGISASF